jgi:hypothetical protein
VIVVLKGKPSRVLALDWRTGAVRWTYVLG